MKTLSEKIAARKAERDAAANKKKLKNAARRAAFKSLKREVKRKREYVVNDKILAEHHAAKLEGLAIAKCRDDFYFYSRYMMKATRGLKWVKGPHHQKICDALMRVYRGECTRLIINIPPRYSKTELIKCFVTWCLGKHPDSEFICVSYSGDLAVTNTGAMLDLMQHEAYKKVFPHVQLRGTAKGEWGTTVGGIVVAAGSGGTITGKGAGKKRKGFGGATLIDDPHKPDEVRSDTMREHVIKNYVETLSTRLNAPTSNDEQDATPIILIMQRLHEEDLAQFLINGGSGEEWDVLCLPAINEDGTALWPEMHDLAKLEQMRATMPYMFGGQYMQRPTPEGGAFFTEASLLGPDGQPVDTPIKIDAVFAVIDTALKTGNEHDGLAIGYFGLSRLGVTPYQLYVLDWDYKQVEGGMLDTWLDGVFLHMERLATETQARYGVMGAWIEDKGSGTVLLQQSKNKGLNTHAIDSKLTSLGKAERAINCEGYVYGNLVKFTRWAFERVVTFKGSTKNHMLSQILRFSASSGDTGADDCLDVFSYGCSISLGNKGGF